MKINLYYLCILLIAMVFFPCLAFMPTVDGADNNPALKGDTISIYDTKNSAVMKLPLEEYIIGVISAEMPASFDAEALKAQAVASRTYVMNKINTGIYPEQHPEAYICTDSAHCTAWISEDEAFTRWGDNAQAYYDKITKAANDTKGKIMVYNNEPIMAAFHAMSSGKTESAVDVWGGSIPYLVSVDSTEDLKAQKYETTVDTTFEDFKKALLSVQPDCEISSFADIGTPTYTKGGAVKSIIIGGCEFSGTQLRSLFSLRSANFTIKGDAEKITFTVLGYGHGVGMSQYGANFLAKEGKNWKDILNHYYTGIEIIDIKDFDSKKHSTS